MYISLEGNALTSIVFRVKSILPYVRYVLTWNGTGADLARRLHAAAEGGSYEDGLTSDDAEISDLDQTAAQGAHPSEQPADHHGQKAEDAEDIEEEEEIDIMNSPLERPWGTDVSSLILLPALPLCMQLY